jgi:hypothetical protein
MMTFATPPPGERSGATGARGGERAVAAEASSDRALHGILVGCVACAPFWLALLVLTLRQ